MLRAKMGLHRRKSSIPEKLFIMRRGMKLRQLSFSLLVNLFTRALKVF
jgi:hypothetical protein